MSIPLRAFIQTRCFAAVLLALTTTMAASVLASPAHAHLQSPRHTPVEQLQPTQLTGLNVQDMEWDPVNRQLYVLNFGGAPYGMSLLVIDPTERVVAKKLTFASAPSRLDASADYKTLAVSLGDAGKVALVDVATLSIKQELAMGTLAGDRATPGDIEFVPGSNDTFAVTLQTAGFTKGLAVFSGGARLGPPAVSQPFGPITDLPHRIRFVSPGKLIGISPVGDLFEFNLTYAGLAFVDRVPEAVVQVRGDLTVGAAGALWAASGRVLLPLSNATIGNLPTTGPTLLDEARGQVFQASADGVRAYDKRSLAQVGFLPLDLPAAQQLTQFANGFAVAHGFELLLLSPPDCGSRQFTLLATSTTVVGTPGNDVIIGTPGDDTIYAGAGNDVVCGSGGNDTIVGGYGQDVLFGGDGDDVLVGGADGDSLDGGRGDDVLQGRGGKDHLFGNQGVDDLDGGDGNDRLYGSTEADDVDGGNGTDSYELRSAGLRQVISLNDVADDGGIVIETEQGGIAEGDNVRSSIEIVVGSSWPDLIAAGTTPAWLVGGHGDDTLVGGPAADRLDGGPGNDQIDGHEGVDAIDGGEGTDACVAGLDQADATVGCETAAP